jgi:hypothetical protein
VACLQDLLALLGQNHAAAMAREQPDAQLLLEQPHLTAEGGLGDVQPIGCLAETAELGDVDERAKLGELHGAIQYRYIWSRRIAVEIPGGDS